MRTLLLAVMMFAPMATAHEFNWQPPTEYENGAPLDPATELQSFRLYCDGSDQVVASFPGTATSGSHPFQPGTSHTCAMTAVANDGSESARSNQVTFIEPAVPPAAPVLIE